MSVLIKFSLAMISLLALSVYILGNLYSFSFPPLWDYRGIAVFLGLFGSLAIFYTYVRPDSTISGPCWSLTVYYLFIPAGVMFTQIACSFNFPLTDQYLVEIDRLIGFDWPSAIVAFTELPQWVSTASTELYDSSIYVTILIALFLIFTRQNNRLDEFATFFILTGIITVLISGFIPAESAYEYFKLDANIYDRLSPVVGNGYMNDFYSLRDGSLRQLKVVETQGIVSFPSFHTINSLLLIYVMRGNGSWFAVAAIWNIGIILTTPFDGAHYLTDLIGGALVLAFSIYLVRKIEPYLARVFSSNIGSQELVTQPQ